MDLFQYIIIFFLVTLIINFTIVEYLDRKTKFDENDSHFRAIFIFLGIFCFPFLNYIRKKRKIRFYKNKLNYIYFIKKMNIYTEYPIYKEESENYDKEIIKIKRILALNKLKK